MDIREITHTKYPIIQGGMANIATANLQPASPTPGDSA